MLRSELRKMFLHRKGWILISAFFAITVGNLLYNTQPYDKVLEANRPVYDAYMVRLSGRLTPEKRDFIEDEKVRLDEVHQRVEELRTAYYSGELSESEFAAEFERLRVDDEKYTGFSKIYSQYLFVRENENRCFLYPGGWEVLLGNHEPNYLLLLLLVFLLTPVFCQEYASQMDSILLTQKRSAGKGWKTKVIAAVLVTGGITAILEVMRAGYCAVSFGLPHGEYPLQSLVRYGSAMKHLTLTQAFFLQLALKEVGYLYAALVILSISVYFRRYALAIMAGIAILPLPLLAVTDKTKLMRIPAPWALTIGSLYLRGETASMDIVAGVRSSAFSEVTWKELGYLLAGVAVICVLLLRYLRRNNSNVFARSRRKSARLLALLMLPGILTGCGETRVAICYNTSQANYFENGNYLIFQREPGKCVLYDKQADRFCNFPMDAFSGETVSASGNFYAWEDDLYYVKTVLQHPTGGTGVVLRYPVLAKLNLKKMEESVCYSWGGEKSWFFGLLEQKSLAPPANEVEAFFLHRGTLYYVNNANLCTMELPRGKSEVFLTLPSVRNLAYDGGNIYYTDDYNRLVIQNLDSGEKNIIDQIIAKYFLLTSDGIYFLNQRDGDTLYRWDEARKTAIKLSDIGGYRLYWDPNYCWVEQIDGLYRMNHDGTNQVKANFPGAICCMPEGAFFITMEYETSTFYRVEKDTFAWEKITLPEIH